MQYVVKENDTLGKIADYYGISVSSLMEANDLSDTILNPGMVLKIPLESSLTYYKVKDGDDLYTIASKYDIPVEFLSKINGLKVGEYIYPNQELIVPNNGNKIYLTSKGDSLDGISKKLNVSIDDIVNANKGIYVLENQLIIYKSKS